MAATCTITGTIVDLGLQAEEGATVRFKSQGIRPTSTVDKVVVPGVAEVVTDSSGAFSIDLAANTYKVEVITLSGQATYPVTVPVPSDGTADLATLINLPRPDDTDYINTKASEAAASAILSEAWAEGPTAPGGVGTKSSKTYAAEAGVSATDAATARDAALYAQTGAQAAETGAGTARTGAEAARDEAQAAAAASDFAAVTVSGDVTITRPAPSDGWFSTAEPFAAVALDPARSDANYSIGVQVLGADDHGRIGDMIAYDLAVNGFKIKFTGSTDNVEIRWRITEAA